MSKRSQITAERIRELFDYNPHTGELTRKKNFFGPCNNIIMSHDLEIDGEKHETSRFIWLHHYGEWPPLNREIDHKNRDRKDNRIENLRIATFGQNRHNVACGNQFGCKGIEFRNRRKCWVARIWFEGKRIYIGSYEEFDDAATAYKEACLEYYGEFACPT